MSRVTLNPCPMAVTIATWHLLPKKYQLSNYTILNRSANKQLHLLITFRADHPHHLGYSKLLRNITVFYIYYQLCEKISAMSDQSPATLQIGLHASLSTSQPGASVYPTPSISQASSQAPSPSSPLDMHYYLPEGLEDAVHRIFIDNRSFAGAVRSQRNALRASNGGQYLVFSPVTESQLAKIEQIRDTLQKPTFYVPYPATNTHCQTLAE